MLGIRYWIWILNPDLNPRLGVLHEVLIRCLYSRGDNFCFLTLGIYLTVWIISCSVRSLVALNLNNYGSGRHPWGNLTPEYMEKVYSSLFYPLTEHRRVFHSFLIRFYFLAQFHLDSKQDIISVYCTNFGNLLMAWPFLLWSLRNRR